MPTIGKVDVGNTMQKWILMGTLCVVTFLASMIYSIQAPFYPAEAESKMATPSEYGFILGSFGLTQFILGPIFGTYLLKVGVKNAFHGGIIAAATSTMMFGFLNSIHNRLTFITLSFLLRIIEAAGTLAVSVSTYTIVAMDFPGSVARTFAIIETVYGFGLSLGPTIGIALFNVGGFTLPFITLGFAQFLTGGITYLVLPKRKSDDPKTQLEAKVKAKKPLGFIALLKIPAILIFTCSIISAITTSAFLGPILEPNLRQFNLDSKMFTVMFLIQGLSQAILSIVWGFICDRISRCELITLLGSALLSVASFTIGPFVILPMEPNLVMTAVSLVGIGLGTSAILVSAFIQGLREAANHGFPANESTSGLISGLFMSSISFGCFSGPLIAGVLFHHFGFRPATSILSGINLIVTLSLALFAFTKKTHYPDETKGNMENVSPNNANDVQICS